MSRKRQWTEEQFHEAVRTNESRSGVLRDLGLKLTGGNSRTVNLYVEKLGLDTSHWTGQAHGKGVHTPKERRPFSEILVKNSDYTSIGNLKRRLVREGLLQNKCSTCGLGTEWQSKNLVLVLDHINGNSRDHRIENLRFLCPNCNSQTPTFSRRKTGRYQIKKCKVCGVKVHRRSKSLLCTKHAAEARHKRVPVVQLVDAQVSKA